MDRFSARQIFVSWSLLAWVLAGTVAWAGPDFTASKSLTIQSSGPRPGLSGSYYFNIEGKRNEKFASFGVLVFPVPKSDADRNLKELTLTLVQSILEFAHDGK